MDIKSSTLFEFPLSEEEAKAIDELIPIKTFPKGTVLLKQGQIAKDSYFNLKGLVRLYYLIDGEEKTIQFFTEGDPIASLSSYHHQTPSPHYLECVEACTLTILNFEKEQELIKKVPAFESICRISIEQEFGKNQEILANYMIKSPEQRYLDLQNERPELLNRVPQYILASYLGVKPESLSRIRKRLAEKRV